MFCFVQQHCGTAMRVTAKMFYFIHPYGLHCTIQHSNIKDARVLNCKDKLDARCEFVAVVRDEAQPAIATEFQDKQLYISTTATTATKTKI
jgi:hypothetical protein